MPMTAWERDELDSLLLDFQEDVHDTAVEKGWYDPELGEVKSFLSELALMHSELSEAAEEYRKGSEYLYYGEGGKPEGIAAELADTILRILDTAEARDIPVVKAMRVKAEYNKTRPIRHGGKRC